MGWFLALPSNRRWPKLVNPWRRLPKNRGNDSRTPNFPPLSIVHRTSPVVKIRREDLREIQVGNQKALAWIRSRALGGGTFYFPADFDPETLPVGTELPAAGVRPPMSVSGPNDIANLPELSESDFGNTERE